MPSSRQQDRVVQSGGKHDHPAESPRTPGFYASPPTEQDRRPQSGGDRDHPVERPAPPGFYASALTEQELDDLLAHTGDPSLDAELDCVRVAVRRLLFHLNDGIEDLTASQYRLMSQAVFSGARTIARLLRERPNLSAASDDPIAYAIVRSLRKLLAERGLDL